MKKTFLPFLLAFGVLFSTVSAKENGTFKILSFDGGGVRGAYTAKLLQMLDDELHFLQNVDLFAGTSTGSIIAYSLAYGLAPKQIVELYETNADKIFVPFDKEDANGFLGLFPKYSAKEFKKVLNTYIPSHVKLNMLSKKALSVSFRLYDPSIGSWVPEFFDNLSDDNSGSSVPVIDAILRSSAAPIYFPSYQGYIDGGVISNNPSMAALTRTIDVHGGNKKLEEIALLSLGTGLMHSGIPFDVSWGPSEWILNPFSLLHEIPANPLITLFFDGNASLASYQCAQLLGTKFLRVNSYLEKPIDLDEWKKIPDLLKEAEEFPIKHPAEWSAIKLWIQENFLD